MSLRVAAGCVFLMLLFVSGQVAVRAQDEKPEELKKKEADKKATEALLQRADEEYRIFFRRPEKVAEFWAAIKFEIGVGKFDLAALHLKMLLQKEPAEEVDRDLLRIEEVEGLAPFVRLQTIPIRKWSTNRALQEEAVKNVKTLLGRVTAALEKHLNNPERLNKFIKNLDAGSIEERLFALAQLNQARERAVPYLVEALRTSVGTPLHSRIVDAMLKLDPQIVPPLLEALKAANPKDAEDLDLRLTILNVLKRRGDKRAVPYLWHLTAAKMYPPQIQNKAKEVLAYLLETDPDRLPAAKIALTKLAESCYQHKARLTPGRTVRVWQWNGQQLATQPVQLTPSQAEEFFGLRYAREALDLDPKYEPAQIVLLSLMLERSLAPNLDQLLLKPTPPKLQQLLATIDADLLARVLERALNEGNVPVIVATVHALGERGEARAATLTAGGTPRGIARALHYPDRRVQLAAVKAMLRMPSTPVPVASARIVEVLRRFLAADVNPKALAAYLPAGKTAEIRQAIKDAGLEPVLVKSGKEIFERLAESADYEVILLGSGLPTKELPYLLTNLRADSDQGRLPVLIFTSQDNKEKLAKSVESLANVKVYPDILLTAGEELKNTVEAQIRAASGPKLTLAERKEFARVALDLLWRMARGEMPGYDLRPAQDAIAQAIRNPDLALEALETLGRIPGQQSQARLAAVVLNLGEGKQRVPAAMELNRHIQKYGLMLDRAQTNGLKEAFKNADEPALRAQLALLVGSMRPGPQATGVRLFEYRPDPPAPPAEKKEKEKG
jgi:CheY-like chemotaxis protein